MKNWRRNVSLSTKRRIDKHGKRERDGKSIPPPQSWRIWNSKVKKYRVFRPIKRHTQEKENEWREKWKTNFPTVFPTFASPPFIVPDLTSSTASNSRRQLRVRPNPHDKFFNKNQINKWNFVPFSPAKAFLFFSEKISPRSHYTLPSSMWALRRGEFKYPEKWKKLPRKEKSM